MTAPHAALSDPIPLTRVSGMHAETCGSAAWVHSRMQMQGPGRVRTRSHEAVNASAPGARHCPSISKRAPQPRVLGQIIQPLDGRGTSVATDNRRKRRRANFQIQGQGLVVDIKHVQREPAAPRRKVSSSHLREARNTWPHGVPPPLACCVKRKIFLQQRTWPHQAHVSFKYIPEFRELVEAGCSKRLPKASEPHVIGQELPRSVTSGRHRPELQYGEHPLVEPRPPLAKDDRSSERDPDCRGNQSIDWQKHNHQETAQSQIYQPLTN
jgi:hypothetical protein